MQQNKTAMECLIPMGVTSENVVKKYGLERRVLDEFSMKSHQKVNSNYFVLFECARSKVKIF